ncbi:MAG: ABC transporter ATP-binding protein [Betaproteobacteria bacterium]|nr:ABC transporter ATP-binding protein [Betaproteobacteria bacterium]
MGNASGRHCRGVDLAAQGRDLRRADFSARRVHQAQILNLLLELRARLGLSYLFVSHNLAVVEHMATRVAVMYAGRVVEMNEAEELFRRPRHPYTRLLANSVAIPGAKRRGQRPPVFDQTKPAGSPASPDRGCPFRGRCPGNRQVRCESRACCHPATRSSPATTPSLATPPRLLHDHRQRKPRTQPPRLAAAHRRACRHVPLRVFSRTPGPP